MAMLTDPPEASETNEQIAERIEQENFFDAVMTDPTMADADKLRWLHATCADYWARLEALTAEQPSPVVLPVNLSDAALLVIKFGPLEHPMMIDAVMPSVQEALKAAGWDGPTIVSIDPDMDIATWSESLMREAGWVRALTQGEGR